jgi:hypothetical protein
VPPLTSRGVGSTMVTEGAQSRRVNLRLAQRGFTMPDLREAKALLGELRRAPSFRARPRPI